MPDTDILVSELNSASQINTTDLLLMTQPDGDAQTGYSSRKGTVLQVANKLLKDTEYTTDLPNFDNKSVFGALNEIHNGTYIYKENETPYQLRQTPITANRTLEKLIGVSCAFNQLVQNGNFANTSNWYTDENANLSVANNIIRVTCTNAGNIQLRIIDYSISVIANHKYLILTNVRVSNTTKNAQLSTVFTDNEPRTNSNTFTLLSMISYRTSDYSGSYPRILMSNAEVGDYFEVQNFQVIDLTACFGSEEVADYFYNLEQNTAGSGIALFKQLFPEDYYAYQAAHLESAKPTSKVIYDSDNNVIATYPLGGDELRGLLKVVDGKLVAYGDVKGSDGNGTEVFDIVDLGSLDWDINNDYGFYSTQTLDDAKLPTSYVEVSNIICSEFVSSNQYQTMLTSGQGLIALIASGNIVVSTSGYVDATAFKTAMSDKYLIYEKATPTAKSYTPFTNPMLCGSTEEFTDSRSLKMFCGHDSLYYTSNFKYW